MDDQIVQFIFPSFSCIPHSQLGDTTEKRYIIQNDYEATYICPYAGGGVVEQGMFILKPYCHVR